MGGSILDDPFPYPGDDPTAVRQAAADLGTGRQRLTALVDGVDGSLTGMAQAWQGADADAARAEVATLVSVARELAARAGDAAAAVDRHGEDLDRIRRTIDGLRGDWVAAGRPTVPLESWGIARPQAGPFDAVDPGQAMQELVVTQAWAGFKARWESLVQEQEESARACAAALAAAGSGEWQYGPGSGAVRSDLASAAGLTELTFDDRLDADHAARAWSALSAGEQALFSALGDGSMPALLGGDPAAAAAAWRGLDPMTKQALIHTRASEIGTIDGLPVEARDQANRILLPAQRSAVESEIAALRAEGGQEGYLDGGFRVPFPGSDESEWMARLATAKARLNALDDIAGSTSAGNDAAGQPRRTYLMALDVTDRGRVAIAYGNPDTADQVVSLVPGTGSDLGGVLGDAERLKLMMRAAEQSGAGAVAGVVWTDWETPPDIPHAALAGYADRAVDDLDNFAEGLRHSHEEDQPFRSVIAAHSYGTVLTAMAASGTHTLDADALILLGSPGTDLNSVRDVRLTGVAADDIAQHVFATSSGADPVADAPYVGGDLSLTDGMALRVDGGPVRHVGSAVGLGFSGDPTSPDWGATVFHTPADHSLAYYSLGDHSAYWLPESPPLQTMGDIIADRYHGSRW